MSHRRGLVNSQPRKVITGSEQFPPQPDIISSVILLEGFCATITNIIDCSQTHSDWVSDLKCCLSSLLLLFCVINSTGLSNFVGDILFGGLTINISGSILWRKINIVVAGSQNISKLYISCFTWIIFPKILSLLIVYSVYLWNSIWFFYSF